MITTPTSMLEGDPGIIRVFIADYPIVRCGVAATIQRESDMRIVGEGDDGTAIIEDVERLHPDVLITEIELPSLSGSGFEIIRHISEGAPETSVIVFTGYSGEDCMLKALRAGARGYILKSAELDDITKAIRTVHSGQVCISPGMASKLVGNYVDRFPAGDDRYYCLSEREREVLPMLAKGDDHETIGRRLRLSPYTIQTYRQRIMRKLDLHSEAGLLKYALGRGLISL